MKIREGSIEVEAPRFVRKLAKALREHGRVVIPGMGMFELRPARQGKHRSFGGGEFAPRFKNRVVFCPRLPFKKLVNK